MLNLSSATLSKRAAGLSPCAVAALRWTLSGALSLALLAALTQGLVRRGAPGGPAAPVRMELVRVAPQSSAKRSAPRDGEGAAPRPAVRTPEPKPPAPETSREGVARSEPPPPQAPPEAPNPRQAHAPSVVLRRAALPAIAPGPDVVARPGDLHLRSDGAPASERSAVTARREEPAPPGPRESDRRVVGPAPADPRPVAAEAPPDAWEPVAAPSPQHPRGLPPAPAVSARPGPEPAPAGARTAPVPAGDGSPRLVSAEALDPGFRLLRAGTVAYPPAARRLGRPGRVRLEVEVEPDGHVGAVNVLEETPGWGFGEAARAAYAGARFTVPTVDGRPVRVRWRKTLVFRP